jgi:hypothetical protein
MQAIEEGKQWRSNATWINGCGGRRMAAGGHGHMRLRLVVLGRGIPVAVICLPAARCPVRQTRSLDVADPALIAILAFETEEAIDDTGSVCIDMDGLRCWPGPHATGCSHAFPRICWRGSL